MTGLANQMWPPKFYPTAINKTPGSNKYDILSIYHSQTALLRVAPKAKAPDVVLSPRLMTC